MQAVICTRYGPPEVLQLREVARPTPQADEILIAIRATTVSARDFRIRSFTVPPSYWIPSRLALGLLRPRHAILGAEFAGEVAEIGRGVTQFRPGDQVFGLVGHSEGTYAEYLCRPEGRKQGAIGPKPAGLSYAEAAAIPFGGLTALHFLLAAAIRPGQRVLIYGASGSVGSAAVQLAKHYGAEVTAVCSTANLDLVRALGADEAVDYTREDFARRPERYDVVFEAVGKSSLAACLRALRPGGVLLHAVAAPGVSARMRWAARTTYRRFVGGGPTPAAADLAVLKDLVEAGSLRPVIDRRYRLDQIVEAHRYVDGGHKRGAVVITVGDGQDGR